MQVVFRLVDNNLVVVRADLEVGARTQEPCGHVAPHVHRRRRATALCPVGVKAHAVQRL